jgi:tRNA pseudouridine32 synthase / 23S rRNA pseudouridine746 synthase
MSLSPILLLAVATSLSCAFAFQRIPLYRVYSASTSPKSLLSASFIDENEDNDSDINAGLGKEQVIYVDKDIIVVDKPTFTQTAPGFRELDSLATRIADQFTIPRIDKMIVHRLDYATSGVLIFARSEAALSDLHEQFRHKSKVYKRYSAIVKGTIRDFEGYVDLPLGKDPIRGPPLCRVDPEKGKQSVTLWNVHATGGGNTHMHLRPMTGRTHQLRIHMASLGHPIIGDLFYAPKEVYRESKRLLLHAEELRIVHPRTREPMRFVAPCPFSLDDL